MTEEYIRDFTSQKIIGIIRTESNGDQVAIEYVTRRILGYYRKKINKTTDLFGRILSEGNSVASLLYNK